MHRYEELEKLYYRKKYIKLIQVIFLIIILVSISLLLFNKFNNHSTKSKNIKVIKKELNKTNENNKTIHKTSNKIKQKTFPNKIKKLTLYPIFPDITKITKENNISKKLEKNVTTPKKKEKEKKLPKIVEKKPEIKIIVKQQKEDLNGLIKLYKINHKYDTAMKIARIYFSKKDYANSIKWAKVANKIDPENDASWYLFSKSLLQLGNRKKAKEVLVVYLNTYGTSEKIEKLLRSIK